MPQSAAASTIAQVSSTGVLGRVDRIEAGRAAATAHDLDLGCAIAQVESGRFENLRHTIRDIADTHSLEIRQVAGVMNAEAGVCAITEIAVTGGLRNESARGVEPRAHHPALVDGQLREPGRRWVRPYREP